MNKLTLSVLIASVFFISACDQANDISQNVEALDQSVTTIGTDNTEGAAEQLLQTIESSPLTVETVTEQSPAIMDQQSLNEIDEKARAIVTQALKEAEAENTQ